MGLVERAEWSGLVGGNRTQPVEPIIVRACLQPSPNGVSGSFMAVGSDGQEWWVKPPGQPDLDKALVTEFVVGRVGTLIGAPTCRNALVLVTTEFAGWTYRPGRVLREGLGHGTLHVPDAIEKRPTLEYRQDDDNRRRHVGIFALYDWCWGSDEQWLHRTSEDMTTYSHDHGWYLPPPGRSWSIADLEAHVDLPHPLGQETAGLSWAAVQDVSSALDKVDRQALAGILRQVPEEWPVSDSELEALGWFLERRAAVVATRLRQSVPGNEG
jgi:hypothetical protein